MQLSDWIPVIIAVLGSIPGILVLRSQFAKDRIADRDSKSAAETAQIKNTQVIMDMAMAQIKPLRDEIDDLRQVVEKQGRQIRYLRTGVGKLCDQIKDLGHEPVFLYQEDWDAKTDSV